MNESDIATIPPTDEETAASTPESSSFATETRTAIHTFTDQVEGLIRRHPMVAALATVGFGCAVGVAARALMTPPPSPKHRVLNLLEDIQDRLVNFAEPAYERASDLADEGRNAVKHGMHSLSDSRLATRLRHLFS